MARIKEESGNILMTGGYGFIASFFAVYFCKEYAAYRLIHICEPQVGETIRKMCIQKGFSNYIPVTGKASDSKLVQDVFEKYDIRGVIHFTCENAGVKTDMVPTHELQEVFCATAVLLDTAYRHWMEGEYEYKKGYRGTRFLQVSTNKVFSVDSAHSEYYAPVLPETAAKAGADMLVLSYFKTFGMNTGVSHCDNNYGPRQALHEFIPTLIHKCMGRRLMPIIGNGKDARRWLYVGDHCEAIDVIFRKGEAGEEYTVTGAVEIVNTQMAETIADMVDGIDHSRRRIRCRGYIVYLPDKPGHVFKYTSDKNARVKKEFDWKPIKSLQEGLSETVNWYVQYLQLPPEKIMIDIPWIHREEVDLHWPD